MKRRNFLQLAALAGLGVSVPISPRPVRAQSAYPGPYWVQVNAGGGWDPTWLFNPVIDPLQARTYTAASTTAGIPHPAITIDPVALGYDMQPGIEAYLMAPGDFLAIYGPRLTVVNGIDTSTNNHDAGNRAMWSGLLGEGYPSIGALIAATHAGTKPMAYVSAGGYDTTAGLVPLTRVASADTMKKLAQVNRVDPANVDSTDLFHTADTYGRLRQAQMDRLSAMSGAQYLPKLRGAMSRLYTARESDWEISSIQVPDELIRFDGFNLGGLQNFCQQAQLAVAAFKSGLAASANLNMGGFDTHSNHDRDQTRQLAQLLYGIHFLMEEARLAGIDGQLVVVAASDFGRGPFYNGDGDGAGKDHWPITSMFAMGPGIAGGRVIGGTTADQRARLVVPGSFQVVDGVDGTDGVKLKPEHVHHALRTLGGVDESLFPLAHDTLPLFG